MNAINTSLSKSSFENMTNAQIVCPVTGDETVSKAVLTTLYCVILILSLVGNTLIILIVYRNPRMWTASNFLIVNMAASDLLLPFLAVPRMIVEVLVGRQRWIIDGTVGLILCKLTNFLQDVSTAVSVQSLIAITADRFYAVMFPLKANPIKSYIRFVIPAIWLAAVGLHAPYLQVFKLCVVQKKLYCCQRWPKNKSFQSQFIYFYTTLALVFGFPLMTILILYVFIVYKLFRRKPPGADSSITQNQRNRRAEQNKNIFKLSVTIVVIFFVCYFPLLILVLLRTTGSISRCNLEVFRIVAKLFGHSNCAMNAFVYCVFNAQFRRGFISYLKAIVCCLKGGDDDTNTTVGYSTTSQKISLLLQKRTKQNFSITEAITE